MRNSPRFQALLIGLIFSAGSLNAGAVNDRNSKEAVVNEILFTVSGEPSTGRDLRVYQGVLNEIFQKNKISRFSKNNSDDFLLSRLSYTEAAVFDLTSHKGKMNEVSRKKLSEFSQSEIEHEFEIISKALALIEIKESQVKLQARFDSWFDLLKRKYQLKIKSSEFK